MNLITKHRFNNFFVPIIIASFVAFSLLFYVQTSASVSKKSSVTIKAGETWKVTETTRLDALTVYDGATITAPDGCSLTLTVDGVETGQKLVTTAWVDTQITPGIYRGDVVLTMDPNGRSQPRLT